MSVEDAFDAFLEAGTQPAAPPKGRLGWVFSAADADAATDALAACADEAERASLMLAQLDLMVANRPVLLVGEHAGRRGGPTRMSSQTTAQNVLAALYEARYEDERLAREHREKRKRREKRDDQQESGTTRLLNLRTLRENQRRWFRISSSERKK